MCVDMAPFHSQCPSLPHMFSMSRDMPGVSMSEWPTPLSTIILPRMPRPKKGLEADWPTRMRMFQMFHKAFRHLRGALFKIMSRCLAAVKALRPEVSATPNIMDAVADAPIDTAALGFGILEDPMEGCWIEEQGSTVHSWMWTPQLIGQGGSLVYALDEKALGEDECVDSLDESLEAAFPEGYEGGEQDVDLSEWLEWDSCEESSDGRNFLFNGALEADPERSSVTSEGPEWDSDSSWSDDDDDDDDDEDNSENAQLWESFFRTDDPYNPLSFSSVVKSQATCPPEGCTPKVRRTRVEIVCEEDQRRPLQEKMPTTGCKKVRFSEKVGVRPLVAWAFASRASRDGSCWLQMARDRDRFRRRVEAAGDVIGPVLLPQHRAAVWEGLQRV